MLVFFALGNAKVVFFALGDAKVPNASSFASQWNIGLRLSCPYVFLYVGDALVQSGQHGDEGLIGDRQRGGSKFLQMEKENK